MVEGTRIVVPDSVFADSRENFDHAEYIKEYPHGHLIRLYFNSKIEGRKWYQVFITKNAIKCGDFKLKEER